MLAKSGMVAAITLFDAVFNSWGCQRRGRGYLPPMPCPDLSAPRRARVDALADDIATLSASLD
ncbi:MAG: hypothetical protein RIF41_39295, partial [Polyangiaceae bacterium]